MTIYIFDAHVCDARDHARTLSARTPYRPSVVCNLPVGTLGSLPGRAGQACSRSRPVQSLAHNTHGTARRTHENKSDAPCWCWARYAGALLAVILPARPKKPRICLGTCGTFQHRQFGCPRFVVASFAPVLTLQVFPIASTFAIARQGRALPA